MARKKRSKLKERAAVGVKRAAQHVWARPGRFIKDAKLFKIYVAVYNDKVVGTATLDQDWIRAVFINPSFHGKGIGTKLMNRLELIANKHGFHAVRLKSSPYAVNFYKKLGYKTVSFPKIFHTTPKTILAKYTQQRYSLQYKFITNTKSPPYLK